jgi:hypothetical protein
MESAALWYYFLAEEADFEGNLEQCKSLLRTADELSAGPQGSIHSSELEEAIKKWS